MANDQNSRGSNGGSNRNDYVSGGGHYPTPDEVLGRAESMSGKPGRLYGFGRAIAIRREKLGFSQHALSRLLRPVDSQGKLIEVPDPRHGGKPKGLDPSVVAKMELRAIPGRHRVYIPQLARLLWGTPEEITAGFIPDEFPHQNLNVTGEDLYPADMTPAQKRAALGIVMKQANTNLSAIRDLDPDALMTIASEAMRMKAEIDYERKERERRAQEYAEGDFHEKE